MERLPKEPSTALDDSTTELSEAPSMWQSSGSLGEASLLGEHKSNHRKAVIVRSPVEKSASTAFHFRRLTLLVQDDDC